MKNILKISLILLFYIGILTVAYGSNNTASYFTDTEVSGGHTITTGVWSVPPIEKEDCKKGGWEELIDPDTGEVFKNQGQCVSEVSQN